MALYFYLVHPFLPSVASFQLPVYIAAPNLNQATQDAEKLRLALETQFDILFEPSEPVLVIDQVNKNRFDALIKTLVDRSTVSITLPRDFGVSCFQQAPYLAPLLTLEARILVPGQHSSIYSL